ncbi:alpha/beta hydrolase [Candidatus Gottesmanbacteria bacterium]|nr:alpha/beta hydrolase [Candidatus Gottesmanbacteria bacterium]
MKRPPLVILHGWGLSGSRFEPLVRELEKRRFTVYAPDFPGFGKAYIPTRPWFLRDYVSFLDDYIKKHSVVRPILIGHSFGGRVALKYCERKPKNITAMVLSGTPGFTPIPKRKLLLFIVLAKVGRFIFSIPPINFFQDHVRKWYYYVVGAKEFFRAEGAMRETFKRIVQEDLVTSMEAISIPTILIWGELDIIVPLSIAERMHRVIEGSQLVVVADADHGAPYKQPEIFASYIEKFIAKLQTNGKVLG